MTRRAHPARRGFSLVEAVVVIVVVAVLVPPSVSMLSQAQAARVDATQSTRAAVLARAVMEQVLADVSSPSGVLGMAALASPTTYLDAPVIGLRARLADVTGLSSAVGLTWDVSIGGLVSSSGAADSDPARNIYRTVQVSVSWRSARSGTRSYSLSTIVTDLTP